MKKLLSVLICVLLSLTTTWAEDNITVTVVADPAYGGDPCAIGYKQESYEDESKTECLTSTSSKSALYWYIIGSSTKDPKFELSANPSDGYTFVGWEGPDSYTYTYKSWGSNRTETAKITYTNKTDENITVVFERSGHDQIKSFDFKAKFTTPYYYINNATVKVIGSSDSETPGWVYVDAGEKEYNAISDSEWQRETATYGEGQQINRPTYAYTYYAKANTTDDGDPTNDYTFIGWSTSPDGTGIISTEREYVYTSQWSSTQANPLTPTTLYALFRKDKYYFYQDASAFVVGETTGGEVRITYDKESQTTEWSNEIIADVTNAHNFKATTTDETEKFTITYEAKNNDANLYAFWGWGKSQTSTPTEGMKTLKYTEEYTVSQENTSPDRPLQIDPLYAIFKSYYYKVPAVLVATNSKDAGKVYIDLTGAGTTDGYKDAIYAEEQYIQVPADNAHSTYTCHYYAKANTGAEFRGWSTTADGKNIISTNEHYSVTYEVKSTDSSRPDVASPLYAVFASYIDIQQQDRMICYVDNFGNYNINDTKIILELLKAPKLVAELKTSYPDNGNFSLSNAKASQVGSKIEFDATQGLIDLKLSYIGDLSNAIGKTAYITLTGLNGENVIVERTISVVVEKAPVVTFVPTDGKGAYTVSLTDGSGVFYSMPANAKEDLQVQIAQESMANLEMKLTSPVQNGDYIFFAWKKTEGNVSTYISTEPTCVHEFTEPAVVQAEFIHKDQATFIIKSQPEKVYADLQLALNDASILKKNTGKDQVVVFANDFANSTEAEKRQGILPKGNYKIPAGITLLIPGDTTYIPFDGNNINNFYNQTQGKGTAQLYRKLIVETGTTFDVEGNISLSVDKLYSAGADTYNSRPGSYGQIELQSNAKITLRNGAGLYALGYLTGDKSSSVVAENGSLVYELLQYTDYRGGSATGAMYLNRYRDHVFPINQYYIQNIEVAIEFKYGSTEYLSTSAPMGGNVTAVVSPFITSGDVEGVGLFNIGENSSIIKYYDPIEDRLKLTIRGGTSEVGYMMLDMGRVADIVDVKIDSRNYVLPMNNNMDIVLEHTTVVVPCDMAWLPGATLTIDKTSTLEIDGGNIYIYDSDEKVNNVITEGDGAGAGYFGSYRQQLIPITYTPNNSHANKRTSAKLNDAKWVVDGKVNVKKGGLYTTNGNAQIISNTNGQVQFHSTLSATTTNQAQYIKGSDLTLGAAGLLGASTDWVNCDDWRNLVQFPVNSARLQNADKTYVSTEYGTYTYNPAKGKWEKTPQLQDTWDIPSITIHKPNDKKDVKVKSFINGVTTSENVSNLTISIVGNGFTIEKAEYEAGVGLVILVSYQASGIAGEYVGTITITYNGQTYTQLITAIEDYTPQYDILNTPLETYINTTPPISLTPFINPYGDNVTELVNDANMKWIWSISGNAANQFQLKLGEGDAKLSESQLIFTPSSTGTKTAMLHLTASYTDKGGQVHSTTKEIPLTGIAKPLDKNTLAFADLSAIYVGQTDPTNLFTGTGSGGDITITITDEVNVDASGDKLTVTEDNFGIEGSGESMTINPKKTGTYTIKAVQLPSATVAGTIITKTITIYPRVKWNWENMYFGGNYDNPITFMDGTSPKYTLIEATDAQNVVNYNQDTQTATISAWETGEAEATFTFTQEGKEPLTFTSHIHRDPRRLRVDVNDLRTYKAVNADSVGVQFDNHNKTIVFTSVAGKTSQWTMYFVGVPDELYFTPTQCQNAWQIEESPNGTNWMTTFTWASIATNTPFSHSLLPTTRYLRITYGGAGVESQAVLTNFYVTALTSVKADPTKIYMPTVAAGSSTTKDIVFTYASLTGGLTLSTSNNDVFTLSTSTLPATSESAPYQVQQVTVTSTSTEETTGFVSVKDGGQTLLEIPIKVYQYPQDLPILMATDPLERYYFVTDKTYRTTWEEKTRTIVMDNAVSNASPFVTFHFSDSPTPGLISFDYTPDCKGIWRIQESHDELDWTTYDITPNSTNSVSQTLDPDSRYVRVTYVSAYAEVIDVTNLAIVPTANIKATPAELTIEKGSPENVAVRANNLADLEITCTSSNFTWTPTDLTTTWVGAGTKEANLTISYNGTAAVEYATLNFYSTVADEKIVLATVELTGILGSLTNGTTNIYTGVHDGVKGNIISDATKYTLKGDFIGTEFKPVDISDAFVPSTSTPLFDFLFIFGETTTMDGTTIITTPNNSAGSNAKTPCYIYKKGTTGYDFFKVIDNANASTKVTNELDILQLTDNSAKENLKVYITGFCPYASTGYTKNDEGVFFFQGGANDNVDVYLEDCYLYSRYKTFDGHSFINRSNGESYSEQYVRGSGGVLVFECTVNNNTSTTPFNVTIHTKGRNVLKSHYGCFFESIVGRAYQVSSPVQIHMAGGQEFVEGSYTVLNFDDKWPTAADYSTVDRTNGSLSLQKQVNNAPSIDLGNPQTVVNFNGGQVELQNAQIVSTNYKTTMAISHRSGEFAGFRLSYGLGADDAGGTVNFNDGTTTVQTMKVNPDYVNYYLMDEDDPSTPENESLYTSCLRCPAKTYVMGGSHCMMRACSEPTSKGGAPTDENGKPLGLYKYPKTKTGTARGGWDDKNDGTDLVTPTDVPNDYKVESVTPNNNATPSDNTDDYLNFWFTKEEESSVKPEVDQKLSFWKTCMPYIKAEYVGYTRAVGGPTIIERNNECQTELISNFLYCQIDENISNVIRDNYYAPVKNPAPSGGYESIKPTVVGEELQNYVETYDMTDPAQPNPTGDDFEVAGKIYYITTIPSADVWMTFTAPFDVEKVYVVEAFEESKLENYSNDRDEILKFQAIHNANFAAFFGVAMALGTDKSFNDIYEDYKGWARSQDNGELKRGLKELIHYYKDENTPANWDVADYYLYQHGGTNWKLDDEEYDVFKTDWHLVKKQDGKLMQKHNTYSMFFPYCMGCFDESGERDFWDYWSGKFLVFESTLATESAPHIVTGSKFIGSTTHFPEETSNGFEEYNWPFDEDDFVDNPELGVYSNMPNDNDETLLMTGNPTFSLFGTKLMNVYPYEPNPMQETFIANASYDALGNLVPSDESAKIQPTASFLLGAEVQSSSMIPAKISRNGEVTYASYNPGDGTTTDTKTPTVGGGNHMFITPIDGGINIAVVAPQYVRVITATGAVIFNGYITNHADVNIPTKGIYVISGENESQKIFY